MFILFLIITCTLSYICTLNLTLVYLFHLQTEISKRFRQHIPAPKLALPGHAESYNPPPEYLFTKEEVG